MKLAFKWIVGVCMLVAGSQSSGATCVTNQVVGASGKLDRPLDLDLGFNNALFIQVSKPQEVTYVDFTVVFSCAAEHHVVLNHMPVGDDGRAVLEMNPYFSWRGQLTQVRVESTNATVTAVVVGDGDAGKYEVSEEQANDENLRVPKQMDSKHFRVLYGSGEGESFTDEQAKITLRNLEDCWRFFVHVLKMKSPAETSDKRYRLFLTTMFGGYNGGGLGINIDPSGLEGNPPTHVIPHELMHIFQGHSPTDWYEAHANYAVEQWLAWVSPCLEGPASTLESGFPKMTFWSLTHGRHYYVCWPFLLYLDENPDNLPGIGPGTVSRIWSSTRGDEGIYTVLQRLYPDLDLKKVIGLYARRNLVWDYKNKEGMLKNVMEWGETPHGVYPSPLVARPDKTCAWMPPSHLAPQQGAYLIHELKPPAGKQEVTVQFNGFDDPRRGADWRWSFVAIKPDRTSRFSSLYGQGERATFALSKDESELYVVVAATPGRFLHGTQDDSVYPYQSHSQRQRFPYELILTDCDPVRTASAPEEGEKRHPNGGGYISEECMVDATAYVGPHARVIEDARVYGSARIDDYAQVSGRAVVRDRAVVRGFAKVRDEAVVKGDASVTDWAEVYESAEVSQQARVAGHALIHGRARVEDLARVEGVADVWSADDAITRINGDAVLSGDYGGALSISNGFHFGFMPWEACKKEWIDARIAPAGLFAEYDFMESYDHFAKDTYGVTEALLVGHPAWQATCDGRNGVMNFDGKGQYALLEGAILDWPRLTFSLYVRTLKGTTHPILFLACDDENGIRFSLKDGAPELTITKNGQATRVAASQKITLDTWTLIGFTLDGEQASITIAGKCVATAPSPISPAQLCLHIHPGTRPAFYLGRDQQLFFTGAMDCIRFSR